MENRTNQLSNDELAEQVIIPNLPSYLRDEFELTYRPGDSIERIIRSLTLIAKKTKKAYDAAKNQNGRENGKYGKKYNKNGNKKLKNKCRNCDPHEYADCPKRKQNQHKRNYRDRGRSNDRKQEHRHSRRKHSSSSESSISKSRESYRKSRARSNSRSSQETYMIRSVNAHNSKSEHDKKKTEIDGAEILLTIPATDKRKKKTLLCLVDTGTSSSLIDSEAVDDVITDRQKKRVEWATQAGEFATHAEGKIEKLQLPEFRTRRDFQHTFQLFKKRKRDRYSGILGRDFQQALGIDVLNSKRMFSWMGIEVAFKPMGYWSKRFMDNFWIEKNEKQECYKNVEILDAKYEIPDLNEIASSQLHLPTEGRDKLARLFEDCTALFQARPGKWKGTPIDIELKEGARPQHSPPYRIPQAHMKALRKEIDRLVQLGVLSPVKEAEWASPTFCIPKKDQTIRLLHDFRRVNKMIKRKPFPLPRIQDTTQQVGTFNFASYLGLNMGYYGMMLNRKAKQICTIVVPGDCMNTMPSPWV